MGRSYDANAQRHVQQTADEGLALAKAVEEQSAWRKGMGPDARDHPEGYVVA
ncbi:hypothetical protein ACW5WU_17205 [Aeromonas encheleia]|uniref:hypothetical protein n=1 Tax=Aeromonas encheleia TaxID=73010 RepID=UPI0012EE087E|nr:hypothetical protein [Aeromonas encheleia]